MSLSTNPWEICKKTKIILGVSAAKAKHQLLGPAVESPGGCLPIRLKNLQTAAAAAYAAGLEAEAYGQHRP